METWQAIMIIFIVFAVVIGNLVLLKHTANMPFKKSSKKITKKP
ncbi:DUF2897 family protein [Pseudoalteromonas mariniglutinosa]